MRTGSPGNQIEAAPRGLFHNLFGATMNDPTAVETPKAFFAKKSIVDGVITWTLGDGSETIVFDVNELGEEQLFELAVHGAASRGTDSYASAGGDFAFARAALTRILTAIREGTVGQRAAGTTGQAKPGELIAALVSLGQGTVAEITALLENVTPDIKKAIRNAPEVKVAIAEARTAKQRAALEKAGGNTLANLLAGS
jgi:hypothetical protein